MPATAGSPPSVTVAGTLGGAALVLLGRVDGPSDICGPLLYVSLRTRTGVSDLQEEAMKGR